MWIPYGCSTTINQPVISSGFIGNIPGVHILKRWNWGASSEEVWTFSRGLGRGGVSAGERRSGQPLMSLACRLPDPDQRDITRFGLCQEGMIGVYRYPEQKSASVQLRAGPPKSKSVITRDTPVHMSLVRRVFITSLRRVIELSCRVIKLKYLS